MKTNFLLPTVLFIIIVLNFYSLKSKGIIIITSPVSIDECSGKPASLLVDAVSESKQKLSYQWYKDQNLIPDAVSPLLEFKSLKFDESGLYFCRITNESNTETLDSRAAAVYVLTPTEIIQEPKDASFFIFDNPDTTAVYSFKVHSNDSLNNDVKIQWYMININGTIKLDEKQTYIKRQFNGTQSNNLSVKIKELADNTKFFAIITGKCGSDTTRTAILKKNINPISWTQPYDIYACEGKISVLHAEAKSDGYVIKFNYQWYKDGNLLQSKPNINGINSTNLTFDPFTKDDTGTYKLEARIDGKNYTAFSSEARVNLTNPPKIISFWSDTTGNISFSDKSGLLDFFTDGVELFLAYINNVGDSIRIDDDFHRNYTHGSMYGTEVFTDEFLPQQYLKNNPVGVQNGLSEKVYGRKYWGTVWNTCGSVTSDTLILNDNKRWSIIPNYIQDIYWVSSYNECAGKDIIINREFYTSLNRKILYQWYRTDITGSFLDTGYIPLKDNDRIHGSQTSQLTINNAQITDTDLYLLRATLSGSDTILDARIFVSVYDKPTEIIEKPNDETLLEGSFSDFFRLTINQNYANIKIFTKKSINYPWKLIIDDWSDDKGKFTLNDHNYHFGNDNKIYPGYDGYYYAEIANPCGDPIYTDSVKITVIPKNGVGIISGLTDSHVETKDVYFYHTPPSPLPSANLVRTTIYWNSSYQLGNIQTSVYDIYGAKIEKPDIYFDAINNYSANLFWNCAAFEPGIYFIRVSLAGENMSIPVIVAR